MIGPKSQAEVSIYPMTALCLGLSAYPASRTTFFFHHLLFIMCLLLVIGGLHKV